MVVSILEKGKVNYLWEMDIDIMRYTQESTRTHGLLFTWEEGSNQSIWETEHLLRAIEHDDGKQEHRWTGRSGCRRTHPGSGETETSYWACTSCQTLCSAPDTAPDGILQGTPVTSPRGQVSHHSKTSVLGHYHHWKAHPLKSVVFISSAGHFPFIQRIQPCLPFNLRACECFHLHQFILYVAAYNINHCKHDLPGSQIILWEVTHY